MTIQAGSVEVEFGANVEPLKQGIQEATEITEQGASQIQKSASKIEDAFNGFGNKARQEFGKFKDSATDSIVDTIDKSDMLAGSLSGIGKAIAEIGFTALKAGLTAATTAMVKMAKAGVADTQALENVQIQMIGLTDSVDKGNEAMRMAINYYKNNPFNRFEVTDATKNLVQFGAELNEIPSLLDKLGKVSLSTGAKIDTLAYYYQRMTSDGKINMIDLQQMQTQGIAIFGALAKQLNTTAAGVRELSAQGKLSVEDFKKAFDSLVSDEAMERFEKTLSRQVDRFKGRLSDLRGALAGYVTSQTGDPLQIDEKGIYRSYTKLLKKIADTLTSTGSNATDIGKNVVQGFQKISQAVGGIIDKITALVEPALNLLGKLLNFIGDNSELILPILGGVLLTLTKVASLLPGVGSIITSVTGPFSKLKDNLWDFVKAKPGLSAVLGLLAYGFVEAYKNDEEFKKSIQDLLGALGQLAKSLGDILKTVLPALVSGLKAIVSSGAVTTILKLVAGALSGIAQAIASIPPDNLAMIISFFVGLKLIKANPIMLVASAIVLLIGYIKQLADSGKNLPEELFAMGHNMMTGLFNGIQQGAKKVIDFIKDLGKNIADTFKKILQIHSPSQVFYNMGEMITLGLAEGIEDSSNVVHVAMSNLAADILKTSEKVISNKVDFGILDIKQEYQEWKKVSKLFTQGSAQYNSAIEKMEDARKKANLKILDLQRTYNDALDTTINKIAGMYGMFDEVNLGGGKNSQTILKNLDQQLAKMQEWAEAQEIIRGLDLDDALKDELQAMGVTEVGELSAITQMTADELALMNDMWLKKQDIANTEGVKQMAEFKDDTLDQIKALKDGIDGDTVDIQDAGGRLVESFSEGVYGAMPTLESAFAQLGDYIEKAKKKLSGGAGTGGGGNDDDNLPNTGDVQKTLLDELNASAEGFKQMIPKILLGLVGAWGASKLLPKLFSKIASKIDVKGVFSGATSGLFGRLAEGSTKGLGKDYIQSIVEGLYFDTDEGTNKSKILDALRNKILGINDEAIEEVAKTASKSSKPAKVIAENTSVVSSSMQSTGQSMGKVSSVFDTIKKGAQTVMWIAGAIAAMAGALWLTSKAFQDVDWKALNGGLIEMGIAVVEFGALATLAEKFVDVKGILMIAGIAADIAVSALACKIAYELMKSIDFVGFQLVLLEMTEALVVMGALATAAGVVVVATGGAMAWGMLVIAGLAADIVVAALAIRAAYEVMAPIDFDKFEIVIQEMAEALGVFGILSAALGLVVGLELLGWLSVTMLCDELIKVANALVEVNEKVPEDFTSTETKIKHIKHTLELINGMDLGTVIGMMVTSWSAGPVERIVEMYSKVADLLNKLSVTTLNKEAIDTNLGHIKDTLASIDTETGIISGWLEASAMDNKASLVENAGRIVKVYGDMVDALNKLADFKPNDDKINSSINAMVGVIQLLRNQSYGNGGLFSIFSNMGTVASDTEKIKDIVKYYLEMVPTIQDLGKDENQIPDNIKTKVTKNIENIKDIVLTIGSVDTGGWIDQKESDVGKIQSILNKFTEIEPVIWQISQMNMNYLDGDNGAKQKIQKIRDIVLEIGKVDTGGWIDQKESDMGKIQSILNKFTELVKTTGQFKNLGLSDDATTWVQKVRHFVWEIGQINQNESGDLDNKINIIEKSKTIATKLGEFAGIIKNLEKTDKGSVIESLTSSLNQLLTGVTTTLTEQNGNIENVGSQLGQALAKGVSGQTEAMTNAGNALQGALWLAITNKMEDEFYQGQEMANKFGEGLKSVNFDAVGQAIQSSVWWGIQNRIPDEYWQGRSMGEQFRQGLYDIDYANSGWWAVQGFVNGVNNRGYYSGGDSVYWVGYNLANTFLRGLKDRSGEGSPWKTTIESGNWAVEGLIKGMQESEHALVGEAESLADQVVDALTLDDIEMAPSLDLSAPSVAVGSQGAYVGSGRNVIIEQTNNNYTEYDLERINRDLAWNLAKV